VTHTHDGLGLIGRSARGADKKEGSPLFEPFFMRAPFPEGVESVGGQAVDAGKEFERMAGLVLMLPQRACRRVLRLSQVSKPFLPRIGLSSSTGQWVVVRELIGPF
jgi:hypothetical protein